MSELSQSKYSIGILSRSYILIGWGWLWRIPKRIIYIRSQIWSNERSYKADRKQPEKSGQQAELNYELSGFLDGFFDHIAVDATRLGPLEFVNQRIHDSEPGGGEKRHNDADCISVGQMGRLFEGY